MMNRVRIRYERRYVKEASKLAKMPAEAILKKYPVDFWVTYDEAEVMFDDWMEGHDFNEEDSAALRTREKEFLTWMRKIDAGCKDSARQIKNLKDFKIVDTWTPDSKPIEVFIHKSIAPYVYVDTSN